MLSSHVELIGRHLHPTGQPFDGYAMRQAKRWHNSNVQITFKTDIVGFSSSEITQRFDFTFYLRHISNVTAKFLLRSYSYKWQFKINCKCLR